MTSGAKAFIWGVAVAFVLTVYVLILDIYDIPFFIPHPCG